MVRGLACHSRHDGFLCSPNLCSNVLRCGAILHVIECDSFCCRPRVSWKVSYLSLIFEILPETWHSFLPYTLGIFITR